MLPATADWFERRTSALADWPLPRLLAAKGDTCISVVLPALDEEATVGAIVAAVQREGVATGLVDEVLVVDAGSSDCTGEVARAAGARVVRQAQVLGKQGDRPGKGEALWKSLAATEGDILVFIDADLRDFSAGVVRGLVGPLLGDPGVALVKGLYDRQLDTGHSLLPAGGGRVTELVARPLLNQLWPELAGFVQPLSGEYAARRCVLERVPFVAGYGVELGLLIDLLELVGLDAMAQVDLGTRRHRHQSDAALGQMAAQLTLTAWSRLARQGRLASPAPACAPLTQFARADQSNGTAQVSGPAQVSGTAQVNGTALGPGYTWTTTEVVHGERPPMQTVEAYRSVRAERPAKHAPQRAS